MTGVPAPAGPRPGAKGFPLEPFIGALLPVLLLVVFFPPRLDGPINALDEGIWLSLAQALTEGKRLYRDVGFYYGPLLAMALKAAFAAAPPTLALVRGVFWALNAAGLLAACAALARFVRDGRLRALFSLFIFLVPSAAHAPIPFAARYGAGFWPMLLWPLDDGDLPSGRAAAASGALAAAAYWISPEVGAAALASGCFVFGMRGSLRTLLLWAAGAAAALGAGFVLIGDWGPYFRSAIRGVADLELKVRRPLPGFGAGLWREAWAARSAAWVPWGALAEALAARLPLLSCAATGMLFFLPGRFRRLPRPALATAGLAVHALAAASTAWGRSDRWHIYFALTPALLLWAVLADRARGEAARPRAFLAAVLAGGLVTVPILWARSAADRSSPAARTELLLPRAGKARLPDGQARAYAGLAAWLEAHAVPGEPFFGFPYMGALYFLTDRPVPTWFLSPMDAVRPEEQRAMVLDLERRPVRWVIWDDQNRSFDGAAVEEVLPELTAHLKARYREKERWGPFRFLERRS